VWFKNHLTDAAKYSRVQTGFLFYFKHMYWALKFSSLLLVWSLAMLLHAFIPQLIGFSVLTKLVEFIRLMKAQHPDDPVLQKITFNDN